MKWYSKTPFWVSLNIFFVLCSCSILKAQVTIGPFTISTDVIDFEKVDVGGNRSRSITFANNLLDQVLLEDIFIEKGMPDGVVLEEPTTFPVVFSAKNSNNSKKTLKFKYSPSWPDTIERKLFFRFTTPKDKEVESQKPIIFKGIALGPLLKVESLEYMNALVGDTTSNLILVKNIGNRDAEFKFSNIEQVPYDTPFEIKKAFLNEFKNKLISIQPQRDFRIPIEFMPKAKGIYKCSLYVKLVGDVNDGYKELSREIKITGRAFSPEIELFNLPDSIKVNIGDSININVKVKLKEVPPAPFTEQLQLRSKLSFRDGALGLAYDDEVQSKDFGTVINGRRVVNVTVPLQRINTSTGEFEADLPMKIVGVLSDNDTTELSLDEPELFVRRFKLENQVDKVKTSVYVKGFWQNGEETRVLLSKGKGNVGIVLENPVVSKDVTFTFNGLSRNASLKIYDNQGTLVFEKEINTSSLPITVPKGVMDFGTYTAVLQYGYEYSTIRFVVVP